jgi:hypothetical protein
LRRIFSFLVSIWVGLPLPLYTGVQRALADQQSPKGVVRVKPDCLGALVAGEKIKLMLRDGTYAEGKVVDATPENITLQVKKTEPKGRLTRPEAVIPAREISVVHLKRHGSPPVPVALGIGGFFGGMLVGALASGLYWADGASPAMLGATWGGAIGGAVAGAYGGTKLAEKTVTINVSPDK